MVDDIPGGESEHRLGNGPKGLLYVASIVMRLRVWAELLREVPDDEGARREVRALAAALVHHADQHRWAALGVAAGRMIRELCVPLDAGAVARLQALALRLEHVTNERAHGGTDLH